MEKLTNANKLNIGNLLLGIGFFVGFMLVLASGCSQSVGEYEKGPLSTWTFRNEIEKATIEQRDCWDDAEENATWCRENPEPGVDCGAQQNLDTAWCQYWYMRKVNKVPLRECGVAVYFINGTPDDEDYSREPNMEDEDEDGLKTYWEAWLRYNPCHQYSFGSNFPMDGSDDFDADGYIDREDDFPICNGSFIGDPDALPDPGDYPSDCV